MIWPNPTLFLGWTLRDVSRVNYFPRVSLLEHNGHRVHNANSRVNPRGSLRFNQHENPFPRCCPGRHVFADSHLATLTAAAVKTISWWCWTECKYKLGPGPNRKPPALPWARSVWALKKAIEFIMTQLCAVDWTELCWRCRSSSSNSKNTTTLNTTGLGQCAGVPGSSWSQRRRVGWWSRGARNGKVSKSRGHSRIINNNSSSNQQQQQEPVRPGQYARKCLYHNGRASTNTLIMYCECKSPLIHIHRLCQSASQP